MVKILIGCKYYVRHLNKKDFEIFLAGQAALQMSQISRSCVHELLNVFEDSAQHIHTCWNVLTITLKYCIVSYVYCNGCTGCVCV